MNNRVFSMIRKSDFSGVSGTGRVLDGIVWHNGKVSVCWRTDPNSSITVYDSLDIFKRIHIDSHPNNGTELVWYDTIKAVEEKPKETPPKITGCVFDEAWRGSCSKAFLGASIYCADHFKLKCSQCKTEQATHSCDFAGQFVCGAPLCATCRCTSFFGSH
jgi:hypothetical protein